MSTCTSVFFSRLPGFFLMLVLLLLAVPASAQYQLTVAPRISYGTFRMQDMNVLQQEITRSASYSLIITEQFQGTYLPGLTIGYHFDNRFTVGMLLETGVVNGQVSSADPSRVLKVDHKLKYKSAGLYGQVREQLGQVEFFAGLEAAYFANKMERVETYDQETRTRSYISPGIGVRPFAGLGIVVNRFRPSLSIGYQLYKIHPFQREDQVFTRNDFTLFVNGKNAGPDWSGLRVSLSLGLMLFKS